MQGILKAWYGLFISHTPYYPKKKKRTNKRSKTTSGFFWLGHLEETFSAAAGMEFRLFFIFQRHSSIGGCIDKKSIKTARFQADNHVIWCCVVRSYTIFLKAVIFLANQVTHIQRCTVSLCHLLWTEFLAFVHIAKGLVWKLSRRKMILLLLLIKMISQKKLEENNAL